MANILAGTTPVTVYGDGNTGTGYRSYTIEDFMMPAPANATVAGLVSAVTQGVGNTAGAGAGGVSLTATELCNHPGLAYATSTATGYTGLSVANTAMTMVNSSGITFMHTFNFRTPTVASTATDAYTLYVGCFATGSSNAPADGFGISYTHSLNGGNWQTFTSCAASGAANLVNNTTALFAPGTWHLLRLIGTRGNWQVLLNEVLIFSLADATWTSGLTFTTAAGSLLIARTAAALVSPATVTAIADRVTLYGEGFAR